MHEHFFFADYRKPFGELQRTRESLIEIQVALALAQRLLCLPNRHHAHIGRVPTSIILSVVFYSLGPPSPLFSEKLNDRNMKCWLVRCRGVVALTLLETCGSDFFQKTGNLLIGGIPFSIEYQHRHIDSVEPFNRQSIRDGSPNDSGQHLRVRSGHPSRDDVRRAQVSRNNFALVQDSRSLLSPHLMSERTRHRVRNRPILWEFQDGVFHRVVPYPREDGGLYLRWAQHE